MSTMYDPDMIDTVTARGYDHAAHIAALEAGDIDQISITHPANWMTEFEVEVCTTLDKMIADDLVRPLTRHETIPT